jgi:hypothetical protein
LLRQPDSPTLQSGVAAPIALPLRAGACDRRLPIVLSDRFLELAGAADLIDSPRRKSASAVASAIRNGISSPKNKGFCDFFIRMRNRLQHPGSSAPEQSLREYFNRLHHSRWCGAATS